MSSYTLDFKDENVFFLSNLEHRYSENFLNVFLISKETKVKDCIFCKISLHPPYKKNTHNNYYFPAHDFDFFIEQTRKIINNVSKVSKKIQNRIIDMQKEQFFYDSFAEGFWIIGAEEEIIILKLRLSKEYNIDTKLVFEQDISALKDYCLDFEKKMLTKIKRKAKLDMHQKREHRRFCLFCEKYLVG